MTHGHRVERGEHGKRITSQQAKKSQTNKVRHRNKWFLIETTNNEEGGEYGVDYQDSDDDYDPVCSSDKHGSVGLAIDTTS